MFSGKFASNESIRPASTGETNANENALSADKLRDGQDAAFADPWRAETNFCSFNTAAIAGRPTKTNLSSYNTTYS